MAIGSLRKEEEGEKETKSVTVRRKRLDGRREVLFRCGCAEACAMWSTRAGSERAPEQSEAPVRGWRLWPDAEAWGPGRGLGGHKRAVDLAGCDTDTKGDNRGFGSGVCHVFVIHTALSSVIDI
jgi:hypothetical protein